MSIPLPLNPNCKEYRKNPVIAFDDYVNHFNDLVIVFDDNFHLVYITSSPNGDGLTAACGKAEFDGIVSDSASHMVTGKYFFV